MLFDPLARTIAIYNAISAAYASQWFETRTLEPFVERFLQALPDAGPILDAGCGCGREIHYLSKRTLGGLPADCVGIDLSFGLIEQARSRVPDAFFRVMDLRNPEFPDSIFSGITCFAVWNHFFEEDIFSALLAFRRILKPGGIAAITLKSGTGHNLDNYGRVTIYYEPEKILNILKEYGFSIEAHTSENDSEGRSWLQILARCDKPPELGFDRNCAFCAPALFPQNKMERYPVAGSILWGDSDIFCALDCAPLIEGHLLLITGRHHYSYMSSDIPYTQILKHKEFASTVLENGYNVTPTFLEHGTIRGGSGIGSCIEHAHLHALPLKRGLKTIIEKSVGQLVKYRDGEALRGLLGSKAYIFYEDRYGDILVKSDGIETLESQFFRIAVGTAQKLENPKWGRAVHDVETRARFQRTLHKLVPVMDKLQLEKPIFSRITETRRARLFTEVKLEENEGASSVITELRSHFGETETLLDVGEKNITEQIIYRIFDSTERRIKTLGDDAAIIPLSRDVYSILVTTDACPTPIIFDLEPPNYRYYGWLSLVVSISDLAAMGAEPLGAVLACEMPEKMKVIQFLDFLEGAFWAAERFHCPIVGGNIKDARTFNVTSTVIGTTRDRKPLRRLGASIGEGVYAIGNMGYLWAAILNKQYQLIIPPEMNAALDKALRYPSPNLSAGLYLSSLGVVGACMDASDGPTGALAELAEKNGVDIVVDISSLKVPLPVAEVARQLKLDPKILMLTWGNWELIFTADPDSLNLRVGDHPIKEEIIRLGSVVEGPGVVRAGMSGNILPDLASKRFSKDSTFSHGRKAYFELIASAKL